MSSKVTLQTTPPDKKHFPAHNQAHYCWQKYNEYVLCLKKNEGDEDACRKARIFARQICVDEWVENWDNQRAEGTFLGVQLTDPEPSHHH